MSCLCVEDYGRLCFGCERDLAEREALTARAESAERELYTIDMVLARRTALDDEKARVDKISKAIRVASESDKLKQALAQSQADAASLRRVVEHQYEYVIRDEDGSPTPQFVIDGWPKDSELGRMRDALATDSGRALLEELAAVKKERDGLRNAILQLIKDNEEWAGDPDMESPLHDLHKPYHYLNEALAASTPGEGDDT